jgi:hypothetical protein
VWSIKTALVGCARTAKMSFENEERKALWWLIKWGLFWILVLMLFGVPILIF